MRDEALFIPLLALLIPIIVAPVAIVTKHLQKSRELKHRERMKALEVGAPAFAASNWPAAMAAVGIGAGVPIGCFLLAWLASMTSRSIDVEGFFFAMIVSVVALVQAGRLAMRLIAASYETPLDHHANGKPPVYDPDAFDVVSRRG